MKKNHSLLWGISILPALLVMPAMAELEVVSGTGQAVQVLRGDQFIDGGRIWLKDFTTGRYTYDDVEHTLLLDSGTGRDIELSSFSVSIQSTNPDHDYPTMNVVGDANTNLTVVTDTGDWSVFSRFAPLYVGTAESPIGTILIDNRMPEDGAIYVTAGNGSFRNEDQDLGIYGNDITVKAVEVAITGNEGRLNLVANNTLTINGNIEGYNRVYGGHSDMLLNINQNEGNTAVTKIVGDINAAKGSEVNIGLKGDSSSITGNLLVSANGTLLPGGIIRLDFGKNGKIVGNLTAQDKGKIIVSGAQPVVITGDIDVKTQSEFIGSNVSVSGDVTNVGTLTVASGATTIDGGISGTGILTIAEGATLNIGTASVTQGTVTLNGTMLATLRDADDAQLNVTTFDDQSTGILKLAIRGAGTYNVFGDAVFAGSEIETSVYDWDWSEDGKDLIATMKSVEDIATDNNLIHETAIAVAGLSASTSEQLNDLALAIQEKLATNDESDRRSVEEATMAVNPRTEAVMQSVSSSVQSTVTSLASGRMSMPTVGRNGGDVKMTSGGVWAQGIFNKSKQNDAFNGYTRGIAAGMDGTINKNWTIGAGYAFAHSDVTATARDTEIDSSSVFLYGQYKPSAWYVNAIANYTMSDYSEKGSALGVGITADYDVDSFGANVATGYDFAGGITPELALRYMHVDASEYSNSLGVAHKFDSSDYLTAALSTKYAFDVKASKNLTLRPELRYGVKYDIVSDKQMATVTMPGVNAYTLDGERLSRIGGEFGIGMGMNYKGFDLSLNYDIEAREDYTSQSGRVKFRYNF